MDPMTMMAVMAGSQALGGVLGGLFSGGDRDKAMAATQEALEIARNVGAGPDLTQEILYRQFQEAGMLTPEVETAIQLHTDKERVLQENPEMRREQTAGLAALKKLSQTGLGLEDMAALNKARNMAGQDAQANINAIRQNFQQRGQGGTGAELMAQLAASQQGAQQAADQNIAIAGNAAAARRDALIRMLDASSGIRNQDVATERFNVENLTGLDKFRDQNSLARQERNIGRLNDAQRFNLQRAQNVSDKNVGQYNDERLRQMNAKQVMHENKIKQAQLMGQALTGQANVHMGNAANTQQSWSNIGQGAGSMAAVAMSGKASPDVDTFDANQLTGSETLKEPGLNWKRQL